MPVEERLAKAREIIALGQAYLPLLARQRAEHEQAKVAAEQSEADAASAEQDEKDE
jgi:hypothetical protein